MTKTSDRPAGRGSVDAVVREFYTDVPFPGTLNAYGPWRDQAPRLLTGLGLDPEAARGASVLDAGCGTGEYARSFANLGARVTAMDITEASLQRARQIDRDLGLDGIEYVNADLFELPEGDRFDIVLSLGVLHHTYDPARAFRAVAQRVVAGGFLIVGLYDPISRWPVRCSRGLINVLSQGNTERGITIARRCFRPLIRRYLGPVSAQQRQRVADLLIHPHEKPVRVNTVLDWYRKQGFAIVGSNPSFDPRDYTAIRAVSGLLPRHLAHLLVELRWATPPWFADYYVAAGRRVREPRS